MLDGIEGALSRGRTVLVGWVLPFCLVAVPTLLLSTAGAGRTFTFSTFGWKSGQAELMPAFWTAALLPALLAVALVAAGGLLMNLFRTPLYRILAGHLGWPRQLADHRRMSHFVRRNRLRDRAVVQHGTAKVLLAARATRYPGSSDQLAPTLFGNALRRVEVFGFDRYRLDSRLLWQELRSVVPPTVLAEEIRARRAIDFFVCLVWSLASSVLVLLVSFALLTPSAYPSLAVGVLAALAAMFGAYHGAVHATDRWDSTVRSLVNLGRTPLADKLGLQLPDTLEAEREMWRRVNWLVRLDFDERLSPELDSYRHGGTTEHS